MTLIWEKAQLEIREKVKKSTQLGKYEMSVLLVRIPTVYFCILTITFIYVFYFGCKIKKTINIATSLNSSVIQNIPKYFNAHCQL